LPEQAVDEALVAMRLRGVVAAGANQELARATALTWWKSQHKGVFGWLEHIASVGRRACEPMHGIAVRALLGEVVGVQINDRQISSPQTTVV
jgi:hypothetical protein